MSDLPSGAVSSSAASSGGASSGTASSGGASSGGAASSSRIESRERLQRHIDAARAGEGAADDEWVVVDVEAPLADADAVLQRFPEQDAVLWSPPHGPEYAGLGIAQSIEGHGAARFDEVHERSRLLWRRLRALSAGPSVELAPRLFGGFAFSADGARAESWREFGDARFVLPRVLYARDRGRAVLSLVVQRGELRSGSAHEHVRLFQRVQDALAEGVTVQPVEAATEPVERTGIAASAFRARIDALLALIRTGDVRKVVTAQELVLRFERALDPIATAIALRDEASECVRFVFRWTGGAFVGATPERLLHKRGLSLTTEALAGTIAAGDARSEDRLQGSRKELEEHQYVVSSITRVLEPLCAECRVASAPEIRRLKRLLHLQTPISAELRAETHVLELLERLHPTPAVGGVPTERAIEWIRAHEPFDRGWYAGAVGWFDASGDGDFNVALRSGLLSGREARLFAGGGIVKDSVPQDEYEETNLKLAALLAALRSSPR